MLIGIDFDNTIACYDQAFPRAAAERGLVPPEQATSKFAVRDYLRKAGQEDRWTQLQGYVYGPGMRQATPFPGVAEFLRSNSARLVIVSHRTRYPYLGERYDLHQSARDWLAAHGNFGFSPEQVFFELEKAHKCARIAATGCTHFIDDLPEFLADMNFPAGVKQFLFDPGNVHAPTNNVMKFSSWHDISTVLP